MSVYFGEPWPSGVCDEGEQVATPVGARCIGCKESIVEGDRGTLTVSSEEPESESAPLHRECGLRIVLGGIGHHLDHSHWCEEKDDPDAGLTYRQSALEVWKLFGC